MYMNDFSVRIPEGHETSGGYVELRHGQSYTLRLRNSRSVRCDARVEVDGKHVGTWRIPAHGSIVLERPEHDTGKFTFYKLGTADAEAAQLDGNDPNLGLVKVTFTPEREGRRWWYTSSPYPHYPRPLEPRWPQPPAPDPRYTSVDWDYYGATDASRSVKSCASAMPSASAGGTGLSGESGQRFGVANRMEYDYSQQTTIHLRLVCKDEQRQGPRPLTATSNPIPPRIW